MRWFVIYERERELSRRMLRNLPLSWCWSLWDYMRLTQWVICCYQSTLATEQRVHESMMNFLRWMSTKREQFWFWSTTFWSTSCYKSNFIFNVYFAIFQGEFYMSMKLTVSDEEMWSLIFPTSLEIANVTDKISWCCRLSDCVTHTKHY